MRAFASLLGQTVDEWQKDKASRLAAALAYYTIFSLAPTLIIAIAVAGLVFGHHAAQGEMISQIRGLIGDTPARAVSGLLASAARPRASIFASLLGLAALFIGATGVFTALQDGLNTVWGVERPPGRSWWRNLLVERLQAFAMVLGIGFLLLVLLLASAVLSALGKYFGGWVQEIPGGQVVNIGVSFIVITLLFGMMYKLLPDVDIAWSDVWIGAAATSLLFTLGKQLIGLYLGRSTVSSPYGAAGSLVLILLWVYYSAQIFFFGAEFTQVYANRYGSQIRPKADTLRMAAGTPPEIR